MAELDEHDHSAAEEEAEDPTGACSQSMCRFLIRFARWADAEWKTVQLAMAAFANVSLDALANLPEPKILVGTSSQTNSLHAAQDWSNRANLAPGHPAELALWKIYKQRGEDLCCGGSPFVCLAQPAGPTNMRVTSIGCVPSGCVAVNCSAQGQLKNMHQYVAKLGDVSLPKENECM